MSDQGTPTPAEVLNELGPEAVADGLPRILAVMHEHGMSLEGVLSLSHRYGGTRIWVSADGRQTEHLNHLLSGPDYEVLVRGFSLNQIYIPRCSKLHAQYRHSRIQRLRRQGKSINTIARMLRVSDRLVYLSLSQSK